MALESASEFMIRKTGFNADRQVVRLIGKHSLEPAGRRDDIRNRDFAAHAALGEMAAQFDDLLPLRRVVQDSGQFFAGTRSCVNGHLPMVRGSLGAR